MKRNNTAAKTDSNYWRDWQTWKCCSSFADISWTFGFSSRRGSSVWVVPLCIRSNNISMAGSSQGTKEEEEYDWRLSITSYFLESYRSRSQSRGLLISCALIFFAIIKQSLGFRIDVLFRRQQEHTREQTFCNPLVSLASPFFLRLSAW
jgi:hypothetical protein